MSPRTSPRTFEVMARTHSRHDPGAQDGPSSPPAAEADAHSPLPGLVLAKSSRFLNVPPLSPTRMMRASDPIHSSTNHNRKSPEHPLLKSSQKSFKMRMRARSHTNRFLPTQDAVETLLDRRREASLQQQPGGSEFVGPLALIYGGGRIKRRSRYTQDEWEDAMGTDNVLNFHEAEKSGHATFWQAILVAAEKIKCAMDALKTLTDEEKIQHSMVHEVFLAVGKLTNTIGLSWEWDHVKNISKVGERHAEYINCNGLKHRHAHMQKKAWVVLEKLENLMKTVKKAPDWKQVSESVESVHTSYSKFFVYLVFTSQIVLGDALFCYRSQLKENEVSCVGRAAARHKGYDELLEWALNIIVGATPKNQHHERLQAMGYDWMRAGIVSISRTRVYRREFEKPLDAIIAAARPLQTWSRSSRPSLSADENDTTTLHDVIRNESVSQGELGELNATQMRRNSFAAFTQNLFGNNRVLARFSADT